MALMLALSILEGFQRTLYEQALRFTWHVQVRTFGGRPFAYGAVLHSLRTALPGALLAVVREREALVQTRQGVEGVLVRALSVPMDSAPVQFQRVAGRLSFSADTAAELVVGQALARTLGLQVGDTVLLITATEQAGAIVPALARLLVVGIYRSGLARYEELYVYVPFARAAHLLGLPESAATGVDVLLRSGELEEIRSAAARSQQMLGFPFYAVSLYEIHQPLFAWIELQRVPIPLVLGLISLVAVFNVFTFLVLLVVEKTASFAVLHALGMSVRHIRRFLVRQGVGLSISAAVTGCVIALALVGIQAHFGVIRLEGALYYVDTLPVAVLWWHPFLVVAVAGILAVGASVAPGAIFHRLPLTALLHYR
jgi:lipoprotein-releasing system permease protein